MRTKISVVRPPPPLAHAPRRWPPTCCTAQPSISHISRGAQIPIALAASAHLPSARFPPLEVFGRRPSVPAEPFVNGRHPKTFTTTVIGAGWLDHPRRLG